MLAKKFISFLMAVITAIGILSFGVAAEDTQKEITVKMINYNVAGLPRFDGTGKSDSKKIADYIVENNFDIVAVQEDFAYHRSLIKNLIGYDFLTKHFGSIPGGDGLNIFTKTMPIFNEKRVQWDMAFGNIAEGDTLTAKGILHSVIEISDGVYIDFYDIHADAFDSLGSRVARESNYKQIVAMIDENYKRYNRPVIVTGDFNQVLHTPVEVNSNMYEIFHEGCGLKDAWVEIHNDGDYHNFSEWTKLGIEYWGNWDSVEKFLYKDGGGVTVEALDFKYTWLKNDKNDDVSDHAAAECTFTFTVTEDFIENTQELEVIKPSIFRNFFNTIKWIFKDLVLFFSNFSDLIDFFKQ